LLSHESLAVAGEEAVVEAVLEWVNYDPENRDADMATVLAAVQWPLIKDDSVLSK
jgi:uncharacterized membrane protein